LITLPERFRAAVLELLSLVGVPESLLVAEASALSTIAIGRATDRSLLGSMNDFTRRAKHTLQHSPGISPLELAAEFLELPLGSIGFVNSLEATKVALGAV
jgi:hypothetical protein